MDDGGDGCGFLAVSGDGTTGGAGAGTGGGRAVLGTGGSLGADDGLDCGGGRVLLCCSMFFGTPPRRY